GAAARSTVAPRFSAGPAVISPNGNGVNDALHVRTSPGAELYVYVWGGRLHGWRQVASGPSGDWAAPRDGTYQATRCYGDRGARPAGGDPAAAATARRGGGDGVEPALALVRLRKAARRARGAARGLRRLDEELHAGLAPAARRLGRPRAGDGEARFGLFRRRA